MTDCPDWYKMNVTGSHEIVGKVGNMGIWEQAGEKKKEKERKRMIRYFRKCLFHAGIEKSIANKYLREMQETLESANQMRAEYLLAKSHLIRAQRKIERLLDYFEDWTLPELVKQLQILAKQLQLVSNDCLMQEDDMDFVSSRECFLQMGDEQRLKMPGMRIMLQSELENQNAIFLEALAWEAPDFFAYAYYILHEGNENVKEMENDRRNSLVTEYVNDHFLDEFFGLCERAKIQEQVIALMQDTI